MRASCRACAHVQGWSLVMLCRREIMHDMFRLWCLAEKDLLDGENRYRCSLPSELDSVMN